MKEISDIISSYDKAVKAGTACVLTTVVQVEGSSYRRPGARMLLTEDGNLTGAISGGCLEGDALRKAMLALYEQKNKLVTYDTNDEDDAAFGIQLGCNGIVHILFEPINDAELNNPIALLKATAAARTPSVLVTLFSLQEKSLQPGTCMLYRDGKIIPAGLQEKQLSEKTYSQVWNDLLQSMQDGLSQINNYEDGLLTGLLQYIPPPLSLVIAGAGNDAMPLVNMADLLGWEVTLADGRDTHATRKRFPSAKNILVVKAEKLLQQITTDKNTVFVLMTHNYNYDYALFKSLLSAKTKYIGILGPLAKMQRIHDDLKKEGIDKSDFENVFSPVGLDIGAETAEEIALSVTAEIKAVMMNKNAQMLRNKRLPIHS